MTYIVALRQNGKILRLEYDDAKDAGHAVETLLLGGARGIGVTIDDWEDSVPKLERGLLFDEDEL